MSEFDKIMKWAQLGSSIFDGIMQIINVATAKNTGELDPQDAYEEIDRIDKELDEAVARESAVFKKTEDPGN